MKNDRTVRHILGEHTRGRIDRARVLGMTEEEIDAIAEADPDNPPSTAEELAMGQLVFPADRNKVPIYIRLDADIVAFYKAGGPGYQTRMNADLKEMVRRHQRTHARTARRPSLSVRPVRVGKNTWSQTGAPVSVTTRSENAA